MSRSNNGLAQFHKGARQETRTWSGAWISMLDDSLPTHGSLPQTKRHLANEYCSNLTTCDYHIHKMKGQEQSQPMAGI